MTDAAALPDRPGMTLIMEGVVSHGRNGLLMDFCDIQGIADAATGAMAVPGRFGSLRWATRNLVREGCKLIWACLPAWRELVGDTVR